jgi:broad specificity phosphatase PhoE
MILLTALLLAQAQVASAAGAATASGPTTVILVRHAEKADDGTKDPGLSDEGRKRSEALAKALSGKALSAVIVSDTKRARDTGDLVAKEHGLTPVEVATSGGGEAHVKGVVTAIRAAPPGVVLVVGHSNTLALIIAALGGPRMPALCEKQFAPMYVLEIADGAAPKLATKSYGAADPPGAEACAK